MDPTTPETPTPWYRGHLFAFRMLSCVTVAINANAMTAFFVGDDFDFLLLFDTHLVHDEAVTYLAAP